MGRPPEEPTVPASAAGPAPAPLPAAEGGEFQSPALERLIRQLSRLPGLGRKSGTRIALHLIQARGGEGNALSRAIQDALAQVRNCSRCGAITEADPCAICSSARRDGRQICVVASPVDVLPIERAGFYRGRFLVLGGLLSPLEGVRAADLPFERLRRRVEQDGVREVILALDASVEGETTALYIQRLLADLPCEVTRLATGIPVGGALAYTDQVTLQRAFQFRRSF